MLNSIVLSHFRNIHFCSLNNLKSINYIIGENGVGKTNFLNAIYLLFASPRSFAENLGLAPYELKYISRVENDELHIIFKTGDKKDIESRWSLGFSFKDELYSIEFDGIKTIKYFNKKKVTRFEVCPIIFLKPDYKFLFLVKSSIRREFVDEAAYKFLPEFKKVLNDFMKYDEERNKFLESRNYSGLYVIESKLSHLLFDLMVMRKRTIELMNGLQKNAPFELYLEFKTKIAFNENEKEATIKGFAEMYSKSRFDTEIISESRFDLEISLIKGGERIDLKKCSMGEKQSGIIALFVSQTKYFDESILLLDEPFVHLDFIKRDLLKKYIEEISEQYKSQIFITDIAIK